MKNALRSGYNNMFDNNGNENVDNNAGLESSSYVYPKEYIFEVLQSPGIPEAANHRTPTAEVKNTEPLLIGMTTLHDIFDEIDPEIFNMDKKPIQRSVPKQNMLVPDPKKVTTSTTTTTTRHPLYDFFENGAFPPKQLKIDVNNFKARPNRDWPVNKFASRKLYSVPPTTETVTDTDTDSIIKEYFNVEPIIYKSTTRTRNSAPTSSTQTTMKIFTVTTKPTTTPASIITLTQKKVTAPKTIIKKQTTADNETRTFWLVTVITNTMNPKGHWWTPYLNTTGDPFVVNYDALPEQEPTTTTTTTTTTEPIEYRYSTIRPGRMVLKKLNPYITRPETMRKTSFLKKKWEDERKRMDLGHFTFFVYKFMREIAVKVPTKAAKELTNEFLPAIKEWYTARPTLRKLGEPFTMGVIQFSTNIQNVTPESLREMASIFSKAIKMRQKVFTIEFNYLFDVMDNIYIPDEKDKILDVLEEVKSYPDTKKNSRQIIRSLIEEAFVKPFHRLGPTKRRHQFVESLNIYISYTYYDGKHIFIPENAIRRKMENDAEVRNRMALDFERKVSMNEELFMRTLRKQLANSSIDDENYIDASQNIVGESDEHLKEKQVYKNDSKNLKLANSTKDYVNYNDSSQNIVKDFKEHIKEKEHNKKDLPKLTLANSTKGDENYNDGLHNILMDFEEHLKEKELNKKDLKKYKFANPTKDDENYNEASHIVKDFEEHLKEKELNTKDLKKIKLVNSTKDDENYNDASQNIEEDFEEHVKEKGQNKKRLIFFKPVHSTKDDGNYNDASQNILENSEEHLKEKEHNKKGSKKLTLTNSPKDDAHYNYASQIIEEYSEEHLNEHNKKDLKKIKQLKKGEQYLNTRANNKLRAQTQVNRKHKQSKIVAKATNPHLDHSKTSNKYLKKITVKYDPLSIENSEYLKSTHNFEIDVKLPPIQFTKKTKHFMNSITIHKDKLSVSHKNKKHSIKNISKPKDYILLSSDEKLIAPKGLLNSIKKIDDLIFHSHKNKKAMQKVSPYAVKNIKHNNTKTKHKQTSRTFQSSKKVKNKYPTSKSLQRIEENKKHLRNKPLHRRECKTKNACKKSLKKIRSEGNEKHKHKIKRIKLMSIRPKKNRSKLHHVEKLASYKKSKLGRKVSTTRHNTNTTRYFKFKEHIKLKFRDSVVKSNKTEMRAKKSTVNETSSIKSHHKKSEYLRNSGRSDVSYYYWHPPENYDDIPSSLEYQERFAVTTDKQVNENFKYYDNSILRTRKEQHGIFKSTRLALDEKVETYTGRPATKKKQKANKQKNLNMPTILSTQTTLGTQSTPSKVVKQFQVEIMKTKMPNKDVLRKIDKTLNKYIAHPDSVSFKYLHEHENVLNSYLRSKPPHDGIPKEKTRINKDTYHDRKHEIFDINDNTESSDSSSESDSRKKTDRRNTRKDKLLEKIKYESSYSDYETNLRVSLNDAFIHGADEGLYRRMMNADIEKEHEELNSKLLLPTSESDEEMLLKSNIYKSLRYENKNKTRVLNKK